MSDRYLLRLGDAREVLSKMKPEMIDSLVCDPPAGIAFMGKEWDFDHGGREGWVKAFASIFAECLRVMKPGAHGLVWALPRTSHWTATALEDAGFEIRDVVMHLFGTGFPKSLDVSKAIDKHLGASREETGEVHTRHGGGARSDKVRQLDPDATETPITLPGSPEAARFSGWGTALKPACEHWILVRKPLVGTVAENVLAHGTGGINVDGCRVGFASETDRLSALPASMPKASRSIGTFETRDRTSERPEDFQKAAGRWPAHLVLDEEAAKAVGSGSRFFFVAKPGRKERDAGCEDLPARSGGEATDRADGSDGLNSPRAGAGRTGGAKNHHPTVKSIALMRWLCRLVTPPGGIVLDPFMGSGSTGIAALEEGFRFIGIEREESYMEIATRRIAHWSGEGEEMKPEPAPEPAPEVYDP